MVSRMLAEGLSTEFMEVLCLLEIGKYFKVSINSNPTSLSLHYENKQKPKSLCCFIRSQKCLRPNIIFINDPISSECYMWRQTTSSCIETQKNLQINTVVSWIFNVYFIYFFLIAPTFSFLLSELTILFFLPWKCVCSTIIETYRRKHILWISINS